MSDDHGEIRPKSVPLTHSGTARRHRSGADARHFVRRLGWVVLLGIAALIVGLVFFVVPQWVTPPRPEVTGTPAPAGTTQAAASRDSELPPYQTLLRQQARQQAQDELAKFVELQLTLEERMQVGEWGTQAYDRAKSLATNGDEQFLAENFDAAIASYQQASKALSELIETGEGLFSDAMAAGLQALNERNEDIARIEFAKALTIDPEDPDALNGARRAALLGQVNSMMRKAKNHELAGEFQDALVVYEQVRTLDPETFGLDAAMRETRQGHVRGRVKQHLSEGFAALNQGRLGSARAAFDQALRLDPGNAVALGGLEQVVDKSTNSRIDELRSQALDAERREDWVQAAKHYAAVLQVDSNIQFARDGRQRVARQQRAAAALSAIAAAPEKLSSSKLFEEAQAVVDQAYQLESRGPKLSVLLDQVSGLIEAYREPVSVTLLSDNETQVTLSTVGRLGSFERKEVNLRPGAYTLVGSRDGCRDVRQNIVVRPNMRPVEIRCLDRL